MNLYVRKLTTAAVLLAICIASQFIKTAGPAGVFITGSIINCCLIICALACGFLWSVVLSVVTPITAFLITGAPIMTVVPALMPLIMAGNAILAITVFLFTRKKKDKPFILLGGLVGSGLKALFMALTISYGLLVSVPLPEPIQAMLPTLQFTYSVTQLITALIGTVLAFIIWTALSHVIEGRKS